MPAPRLLAALLVVLVGLSSCGRQGDESAVRETLETFADATARKDYQRLCDELFSSELVAQVNKTLPCEVALQRSDLDAARSPRLEVRSVKVEGDRAEAKVRSTAANQPPSEDIVQLVREDDGWRIAALSS